MSRWGLGLFASAESRSSSLVFGVGGMGGSPYNPAVPCCAEGQAICGFSHREVPPMPPTPEIGAG